MNRGGWGGDSNRSKSMVASPAAKNIIFFASPVQPYQEFPNMVAPMWLHWCSAIGCQRFSPFIRGRKIPQPGVSFKSRFCDIIHPAGGKRRACRYITLKFKAVPPNKEWQLYKKFLTQLFCFKTFTTFINKKNRIKGMLYKTKPKKRYNVIFAGI